MKQTKRLTRNQRMLLLKNKIDVEGVRTVSEDKYTLVYMTPDGEIHRLEKKR